MPGTNPVRSLGSRVCGAPPAQVVMAGFAVMALVAGTWLAFGSSPARAVVGGETTLADNPQVAFLTTGAANPNSSNCTGVLISSTEIMTAGHCVDDGMEYGYLGTRSALDPAATRFTVTKTWKWAFDPELAVVAITPAVTGIRPAVVDTTPVSPALGTRLQIFGYGVSGTPGCGPTGCQWDGNLRMWNAQVQPPATCVVALTNGDVCMTPIPETIANGCAGDSGGPVFDLDTGKVIGVHGGLIDSTQACDAHEKGYFTSTAGAQQFLFG